MKKCCYCEGDHDFESASLCFKQLIKERKEALAEVERLKKDIQDLSRCRHGKVKADCETCAAWDAALTQIEYCEFLESEGAGRER